MEWNRKIIAFNSSSILLFSFFLLIGVSTCSTFISDDIFGSHPSIARHLLQTKKACPINFEFQNYTIITDECRGPRYPAESCCSSFKKFACPFVDELNDLANDCASTMFSYINLHGRYPPGLFASECREGKNGLECPASSASESTDSSSSDGRLRCNSSQMLALVVTFLVLYMQFF